MTVSLGKEDSIMFRGLFDKLADNTARTGEVLEIVNCEVLCLEEFCAHFAMRTLHQRNM